MKILIAEDDVDTSKWMKRILQNEHEIIQAYDGVEALEFIKSSAPDILITDNNMPRKDGVTLVKDILDKQFNTKIIMVTAYGDSDTIIRCLNYGVKYYIKKPIDPSELLFSVQEISRMLTLEHDNVRLLKTLKSKNAQLEKMVRILTLKLGAGIGLKSIKKKDIKKTKKSETKYEGEFNPYEYFLDEDLHELEELEHDIDSNLNYCVLSSSFHIDKINKASKSLGRYAKTLNKYPIYSDIAKEFMRLSEAFEKCQVESFNETFYSYLESFVFTLEFWRENLLKERKNPNRYDKSLISDATTITNFLNNKYEDSSVEFF